PLACAVDGPRARSLAQAAVTGALQALIGDVPPRQRAMGASSEARLRRAELIAGGHGNPVRVPISIARCEIEVGEAHLVGGLLAPPQRAVAPGIVERALEPQQVAGVSRDRVGVVVELLPVKVPA